jgi:hypothetical protein
VLKNRKHAFKEDFCVKKKQKKKQKGLRPVAGGGAATRNCNRRWKLAGRDEDSSLVLGTSRTLERKEREPREREKD